MSIEARRSAVTDSSPLSLSKSGTTTCASLLRELQEIWDEMGESDIERDKMLLLLEKECLDIYRRKVEITRKRKSDLLRTLAESEAEIARIASAMGEQVSTGQYEKMNGSLKQKLSLITPILESLRVKKLDRVKEISEVQFQIARISAEISGAVQHLSPDDINVDEVDLTTKKLGELKSHLKELQFEKNLRLQQVVSYTGAIHELAVVMSLDFKNIMGEIHASLVDTASLQPKSISNETLARMTSELKSLKQEKQCRLQKVQDLGRNLIDLWDLIDDPSERNPKFQYAVRLIDSVPDDTFLPGSLSLDIISQTEDEVARLNVLKVSKMREIILKRQYELEEIYKGVHLDVDDEKSRGIIVSLMDSDGVNVSELLSSIDKRIAEAKEVAQSRRDILDRVEKWKNASEEEAWLDEYERDENRYSAGRGVHKNLKRAERARILVSKIPTLVENLTAKVKAWELDRGTAFLYNKAPLLRTLEEFKISRQEKEEEKRRIRGQKKLQDQLITEQEAIFGSKPNAKRPPATTTTTSGIITPNGRRFGTPSSHLGISAGRERRESSAKVMIPVNYVALPKDDRRSS
ncbi:hypothetical protein M569_13500 [Genlisea aurea]|uniref:Uncharacterized protein n=1 Tax=Genlisea aurea TaxID=192259 RepID=S8C386_9LAMI|nr:hypothetical protein M569_13500 [Genlisea aurea]